MVTWNYRYTLYGTDSNNHSIKVLQSLATRGNIDLFTTTVKSNYITLELALDVLTAVSVEHGMANWRVQYLQEQINYQDNNDSFF